MYFNAEAQVRVLQRFHFALNSDGYLFLGKAEMLLSGSDYFTPLDLKPRIFVKNPVRSHVPDPRLRAPRPVESDGELPAAALQSGLIAQLVLDLEGRLAAANDAARRLFSLAPADVTRPISELPLAHRPVDLAAALQEVAATGHPVVFHETAWPEGNDAERVFDVQIAPLSAPDDRVLGFSASFADVTPYKRLRETLQQVNEERETTHEELQTTNEELQSTVEELETTNEELQSTNEELETMNEELQSTNEELRTTNEQLRTQSATLERTRSFWESVMSSLGPAVVIVDPEFKVLVWNPRAADLWGLRPDEVRGRNLLSLDIGLPVDRLRQPIRAVLGDGVTSRHLSLPATNRRGKTIECRINCSALAGDGAPAAGVVLLMEEIPGGPT
jgi:two-component system CheB/CheR fusion protein